MAYTTDSMTMAASEVEWKVMNRRINHEEHESLFERSATTTERPLLREISEGLSPTGPELIGLVPRSAAELKVPAVDSGY